MTFRTDNNNNPVACTTDVAREGGLVYGIDYEPGDSFTAGTTKLFTAKFLKDPVDTSIRLIDKSTFYTHTGQPRWSYISIPIFVWDALSLQEKTRVIKFMYEREGGETMMHLFNPPTTNDIKLNIGETLK